MEYDAVSKEEMNVNWKRQLRRNKECGVSKSPPRSRILIGQECTGHLGRI
jgi:hypothetical protein